MSRERWPFWRTLRTARICADRLHRMTKTILIAEDEEILRDTLASLLRDEGFDALTAADGEAAYRIALEQEVDLVLSDVRMPNMDGLTLLNKLQELQPDTPVLMLTAFGTVETAVSAMQAGAWDFLLKPVQFDELLVKVRRALEHRDLVRNQRRMVHEAASGSSFHDLVSQSPSMQTLFEQARKLSAIKSTVLLLGESGTGKELFARAIHYNDATRAHPFIAVNCGAIPESLIESELFGHRKGSFTSATQDKIGMFEAANGGTLFLDEVSNLPLRVQGTLLRALEDRTIVRVGDTKPRQIDIRVITASNRDLRKMMDAEEFREDLYYRIAVVTLRLPPLRERRSDIPILVHYFIRKYADEMDSPVEGVTNGVMRALLNRPWRGNVRELENVIEHAMIFGAGPNIRLEDLPFTVDGADDDPGEDLKEALHQFEREHILASLRKHHFDKTQVAGALGIGLSSLYRKLDDLQIPKNADGSPDDEPASN